MMDARRKPPPKPGPTKRSRDRDELEALAAVFRVDWRPGDRVMTWLNRHEGREAQLSRLVEDGWSWADVGVAMHMAGICYSGGQPIASDTLRSKAYRARRHQAARASRKANMAHAQARIAAQANTPPGADVVLSRPSGPLIAQSEPSPAAEAEPEFRPASLKRYGGPQTAAPIPELTRTEPKSMPVIDADAIIARLRGEK
jgi:hypothetical protein